MVASGEARAMKSPRSEWRDKLRAYLIKCGMAGAGHTEIIHKFRVVANAEQLTQELEALWAQDKVQKFSKPTKGKDAQHWRATNIILE